MTDKSMTAPWRSFGYDGPDVPIDVSNGLDSILPAFEANGRIRSSVKDFLKRDISVPELLRNKEWHGTYRNPGFYHSSSDGSGTGTQRHRPTRSAGFATRMFVGDPVEISLDVGVNYSDESWNFEEAIAVRNYIQGINDDLIGNTETAGGDGVEVATMLYNPGSNSDTPSSPAIVGTDADGGQAGSVLDASTTYLGASGTLRTLLAGIMAKWTAVGIKPSQERIALFVPPAGAAALEVLLSDSGIDRTSNTVLSSLFRGGVWVTDQFHYALNSAVSTNTDFDLVTVDMDRVEVAILGGEIRTVVPKTYEVKDGVKRYYSVIDACYGVQFQPFYYGGVWYKGIQLTTACTSAASA